MSTLSPTDVEKIAEALAPKLIDKVQKNHHDFWIDPEKHYRHHRTIDHLDKEIGQEGTYDLKNILVMYRTTKSLWFKAFLGMAALGTVVVIAASMGFHR